jgi:D-sedoheptulose 7-phosphate isomerase
VSRSRLDELYPFLAPRSEDPQAKRAALLDAVRTKSDDGIMASRAFFASNAEAVVEVAAAVAGVFRRGGRLLTMGNGGSSCAASHVAVEFLHPITAGRPALPAIDLGADRAIMTAIGNDVGFEHVFVRQVIAHARAEDGLLGLSTSGSSANLLAAFAEAKSRGLVTIALTGMSGGKMVDDPSIDHCLVVRIDSVHRIQEVHVALYHILWDLVHTLLADARGTGAPA